MVVLDIIFCGTSILFVIVAAPNYILHKVPFFPHPYQHLLSSIVLKTAILTEMRSYLTVVLSCIFLMISKVELFLMCPLASESLLWKNVYLLPLCIFNWVICFLAIKLYELLFFFSNFGY